MRMRHRLVVISLVALASAAAFSGANYIYGNPIAQRDAVPSHGREGRPDPVIVRHLPSPELHDVLPAADGNNTIRRQKTLALLFLMLREGPGAR
jgi:hypothetical protein